MPNYYKIAPTFLYNKEGKSKSFKTQEEVDKAWEDGWFGPPWLLKDNPLISIQDWASKEALIDAIKGDPRYIGIKLVKRDTSEDIMNKVLEFELENKLE